MNLNDSTHVNKTNKQYAEAAADKEKEEKGYGSLTLDEQLELFADLIVEQLLRQESYGG